MWPMSAVRSLTVGAAMAGALVFVPAPAVAGPPLICHPVDIGTARSLPWDSGTGWDATLKSYDVNRLTGDTLALLTPDAAIPLRRETLRRAALYAARDPRVAAHPYCEGDWGDSV